MGVGATYLEAADAFVELVERVPPTAWNSPVLGVWDVRSLVGHTTRALTTVRDYLAQPATDVTLQTPAEYFVAMLAAAGPDVHAQVAERGVAAGRALGDDPPASARALRAEIGEVLAAAGEDALLTTPAGGMRLRDYLPTRVFELTVHSGDLADALGLVVELPRDAVEQSVATIASVGVRSGKGRQVLEVLTGRRGSPFSLL